MHRMYVVHCHNYGAYSEDKAVVSDLISQTLLPLHYIGSSPHPNAYVYAYWYN